MIYVSLSAICDCFYETLIRRRTMTCSFDCMLSWTTPECRNCKARIKHPFPSHTCAFRLPASFPFTRIILSSSLTLIAPTSRLDWNLHLPSSIDDLKIISSIRIILVWVLSRPTTFQFITIKKLMLLQHFLVPQLVLIAQWILIWRWPNLSTLHDLTASRHHRPSPTLDQVSH